MRVQLHFIMAGASLSIHLFSQSVIGVTHLRQRDFTKSTNLNLIHALSPGSQPKPEPKLEPPIIVADPKNTPAAGGHSPASGGSGSNSPQAEPVYAPAPVPNDCLEKGSKCTDIIDKASELLTELAKKLAGAGGSTTTPSGTFATVITPAPMPNYDVITAINMKGYLPLLNTAEQQMWRTDPLCFFANIEGYYTAAASSSAATSTNATNTDAASTDATSTTPASTDAASTTLTTNSSAAASTVPSATSSASLLRRTNPVLGFVDCMPNPSACPTTTSTLPTLSFSSLQSDFFASFMPSALVSAYGAPRNGSLSTATKTCSGLQSGASVTATYVWKAKAVTTTTGPGAGAGGTPNPPIINPGKGGGSRTSVAGAGFLGGWVALLMMFLALLLV